MRQQALAHPLAKQTLLGRIERDACYSRWSGHARISYRLPWEQLKSKLMSDLKAFTRAREAAGLSRPIHHKRFTGPPSTLPM